MAIQAATLAAQLCQQVRQTMVPEAIQKQDKSPVTVADFGSQALICKALAEAFPADAVVAEEDAAELRKPAMAAACEQVAHHVQQLVSAATPDQVLGWIDHGNGEVAARYWTLDPIDGTKGFLRQDQYAIALALIENGDIKVGVLACPALSFDGGEPGLLLVAVRGEGAVMAPLSGGDFQPLQVAKDSDRDRIRFVESVESGHGNQSQQGAIAAAVGITEPSMRMDSQAKYAAVAAGQAALYLRLPSPKSPDYREKIWDHAAGVLIVEEAGGKVTDMHGTTLDFTQARLVNNRGVVVSNGTLHQPVLDALQQSVPA